MVRVLSVALALLGLIQQYVLDGVGTGALGAAIPKPLQCQGDADMKGQGPHAHCVCHDGVPCIGPQCLEAHLQKTQMGGLHGYNPNKCYDCSCGYDKALTLIRKNGLNETRFNESIRWYQQSTAALSKCTVNNSDETGHYYYMVPKSHRIINGKRKNLLMIDPGGNKLNTDVLTSCFGFDLCHETPKTDYGPVWKDDDVQSCDYDMIFGGGNNYWLPRSQIESWFPIESLTPERIWGPYFGCRDSFCNKVHLCEIQNRLWPDSCYNLNKLNRSLIKTLMESRKDRKWILKRDGDKVHLHSGTGVWFVESPAEIDAVLIDHAVKDNKANLSQFTMQPYMEPFLFKEPFNRKLEIRVVLLVTSVMPNLRVYVSNTFQLVMAGTPFNMTTSSRCAHDTHNGAGCKSSNINGIETSGILRDLGRKIGFSGLDIQLLESKIKAMLGRIVHDANGSPAFVNNKENKKLHMTNATAVQFMRADFGITKDLQPVLYEINNWPFMSGSNSAGRYKYRFELFRDAFRLIGLELPRQIRSEKVGDSDRSRWAWELGQLGNSYELLEDSDYEINHAS